MLLLSALIIIFIPRHHFQSLESLSGRPQFAAGEIFCLVLCSPLLPSKHCLHAHFHQPRRWSVNAGSKTPHAVLAATAPRRPPSLVS